jgi:hypothetical protein
MNKLILSLLLITPFFINTSTQKEWVNLTTSETRNLHVSLGQTFTITAVHGPRHKATPWHLGPYTPFELLHEGWNDGCIGVMEANTQIWNFKATQVGTHEIEFYRPYPSPLQAVETAKVSVEVY